MPTYADSYRPAVEVVVGVGDHLSMQALTAWANGGEFVLWVTVNSFFSLVVFRNKTTALLLLTVSSRSAVLILAVAEQVGIRQQAGDFWADASRIMSSRQPCRHQWMSHRHRHLQQG